MFSSRKANRILMTALDAICVWVLFYLLSYLRFAGEGLAHWQYIGLDPYLISTLAAVVWLGCLWIYGTYDTTRIWSAVQEFWAVGAAGITMMVLLATCITVFKVEYVSRIFLLMFVVGITLSAGFLRLAWRLILSGMRSQRGWLRYLLMVGSNEQGRSFAERVQFEYPGVQIIGWLNGTQEEQIVGSPVLGTVDMLPDVLASKVVDGIVVALPFSEMDKISQVIDECENQGKHVYILLEPPQTKVATSRMEVVLGYPTLAFSNVPNRMVGMAIKRLVDIMLSGLALLVLSPFLLIVAIAIKLDSPGPVLFRQQRVGLNGRLFTMLKFRTMVSDAEARLDSLLDQNEMKGGPAFKIRNDPRITRVGAWLRKTSLDEVPQLINVLKGEMSIVGPRPPLPREVVQYEPWHRRRLSVRPGLTCYWQVEGRNDIQFEEWVKLDLQYIDTWSLWHDLCIIMRTIPVILGSKGM